MGDFCPFAVPAWSFPLDFPSPAGMEHVHEDETTNRDVQAVEFGREEQRSLEEKTRELCCFNKLVHQK
jgi:hypothetical protein